MLSATRRCRGPGRACKGEPPSGAKGDSPRAVCQRTKLPNLPMQHSPQRYKSTYDVAAGAQLASPHRLRATRNTQADATASRGCCIGARGKFPEGEEAIDRAEGPDDLQALGIAQGNEASRLPYQPNGPSVLRASGWPVGPFIVQRLPPPLGVAQGWENRCPIGAARQRRDRSRPRSDWACSRRCVRAVGRGQNNHNNDPFSLLPMGRAEKAPDRGGLAVV